VLLKRLSVWLLPLLAVALSMAGCTSKRTRMMDERSALLHERDQIQRPWQPQSKRQLRNNPEEQVPPAERVQRIDQRVAEIDAELLQIK
jgi:hypothetical protein